MSKGFTCHKHTQQGQSFTQGQHICMFLNSRTTECRIEIVTANTPHRSIAMHETLCLLHFLHRRPTRKKKGGGATPGSILHILKAERKPFAYAQILPVFQNWAPAAQSGKKVGVCLCSLNLSRESPNVHARKGCTGQISACHAAKACT